MNAAADLRICYVGDSFVAGVGDAEQRGWVGRVSAAAGPALTAYNLGVRRDTSADIAARWQDECARRLPAGCQAHVLFSFGVNDTVEENGHPRVAADDSVGHLRQILGAAAARYTVAMIGPPPVADATQNQRIAALCTQFHAVCREFGVPYLPVCASLQADPVWMREVVAGDGAHPGAAGYAALAQQVMQWPQWWFRKTTT